MKQDVRLRRMGVLLGMGGGAAMTLLWPWWVVVSSGLTLSAWHAWRAWKETT